MSESNSRLDSQAGFKHPTPRGSLRSDENLKELFQTPGSTVQAGALKGFPAEQVQAAVASLQINKSPSLDGNARLSGRPGELAPSQARPTPRETSENLQIDHSPSSKGRRLRSQVNPVLSVTKQRSMIHPEENPDKRRTRFKLFSTIHERIHEEGDGAPTPTPRDGSLASRIEFSKKVSPQGTYFRSIIQERDPRDRFFPRASVAADHHQPHSEESRSSKSSSPNHGQSNVVSVNTCMLKRFRFSNVQYQVHRDTIGGGKMFRSSQIVQEAAYISSIEDSADSIGREELKTCVASISKHDPSVSKFESKIQDDLIKSVPEESTGKPSMASITSSESESPIADYYNFGTNAESDPNIIETQMARYKQGVARLDQRDLAAQGNEFQKLRDFITRHKIKCLKYNHNVDPELHTQSSYYCILSLNKEGTHLIFNKVLPKQTSSDNWDPRMKNRIEATLDSFTARASQKKIPPLGGDTPVRHGEHAGAPPQPRGENFSPDVSEISDNSSISNREELYEEDFNFQESKASCSLHSIKGFVFGGRSSRFWMLRKHANYLQPEELEEFPFSSWDCLSLQVENRNIDLVIRNEAHMRIMLKFLIYELRTLDGHRNTATRAQSEIKRHFLATPDPNKRYMNKVARQKLKLRMDRKAQTCANQSIMFKLLIMKVRAKISYMASLKKMTVLELFLTAIKSTFEQLVDQRVILLSSQEQKMTSDIIFQLVRGKHGVLKYIMNRNIHLYNLKSESLQNDKLQLGKKEVTAIEVRKFGVRKVIHLDEEEIQLKSEQTRQILKKENCMDVFREYAQSQNKSDPKSYESFLKFKFEWKARIRIYNRIRLYQSMHLVSGYIFLKACLEKIRLAKELLVLEVEQGSNVLIPDELQQDKLPLSFQYYDPVLRILRAKINPTKSHLYQLKSQLQRTMKAEPQADPEEDDKMYIRFTQVPIKERREVDIATSPHVGCLQTSRYIQIDDSLKVPNTKQGGVELSNQPTLNSLSNTGRPGRAASQRSEILDQKVGLKFLKEDLVIKDRKKFLRFKEGFLVKQDHVKLLGQNVTLRDRLHSWLEDFIPTLELANSTVRGALSVEARMFDSSSQQKAYDILAQIAEKKILTTKSKKRQKTINEVKQLCLSNEKLEVKQRFVDNRIEEDLRYFGYKRADDLDMEVYRKMFLKKMKELGKGNYKKRKVAKTVQRKATSKGYKFL